MTIHRKEFKTETASEYANIVLASVVQAILYFRDDIINNGADADDVDAATKRNFKYLACAWATSEYFRNVLPESEKEKCKEYVLSNYTRIFDQAAYTPLTCSPLAKKVEISLRFTAISESFQAVTSKCFFYIVSKGITL
jgi:hypothetical protein